MVPGIPVGVQISFLSLKEIFRMFRTPRLLVFIQYQLLLRLLSGSVEPHVALGLGLSAWFVKHLQCGFVRVEDVLF